MVTWATYQLVVVKGCGPTLLGRDWLSKIHLEWPYIKVFVTEDTKAMVNQVMEKYAEVFKPEPGHIKGTKAHLSLKEGAQPRFWRPRSVPYAIKERVGKELDRLEESGILHKVDYAEWAAPIVVFGITQFHQYLYGRQLVLITDHKSLITILGPKQGIPPLAAARMQRWALLLSAYSYTIQFRPTQAHANADGLSQLPLRAQSAVGNPEDSTVFNLMQLEALPVHASEVAGATCKDPILSKVLVCMRQGWPDQIQQALFPYWRRRSELTIEGDCILWGMRVVIPEKLQEHVLWELHQGHQGSGTNEKPSSEPCLVARQSSDTREDCQGLSSLSGAQESSG